jgi:hypothetical protein
MFPTCRPLYPDGAHCIGVAVDLMQCKKYVWHRLSISQSIAHVFKHFQATVNIISDTVCNSTEAYNGWIRESMVCAGIYPSGGIDTCQVKSFKSMHDAIPKGGKFKRNLTTLHDFVSKLNLSSPFKCFPHLNFHLPIFRVTCHLCF